MGRDSGGKWEKGTSGNPGGRPINRGKYLQKLDDTLGEEAWVAIVARAIELAKRGDSRARQWLSDYILGKPTQGIDLFGETVSELIIRYVNDWRNNTPKSPQGTEDS